MPDNPYYLVTVQGHHDSEMVPYDLVIQTSGTPYRTASSLWAWDAKDRLALISFAMLAAMDAEYVDWNQEGVEKIREAVETADKKGEASLTLPFTGGSDSYKLCVFKSSDIAGEFGFGESRDGTCAGTNKRHNRWISVKPYERLAVWLSYVVEQNEPSQPATNLIRVPNDEGERKELLTELWKEVFRDLVRLRFGPVAENDHAKNYCDLYVSDESQTNYILLTFLDPASDGTPDIYQP